MANSLNLDLSALANVLPSAHNVICFLHPQTTYDAVAAALALKLALAVSGKDCQVICEEPMRVEYNALVDIDQVTARAGNRDLVLSFAYNENQVDKVSYNVDETQQRFELVISPKSGHPALDPSTVQFHHAGMAADVIFLFGYHAMDELGVYYQQEKNIIDSAYTVAITQAKVPAFAKLHLQLQPDQLSYAELIYFLARQFNLGEIKDDIASNLLSGIEYATDRFQQPTILPRTFETCAYLMRQGAHRVPENPAFLHLSTPIRGVAKANGAPSNHTIMDSVPTSGSFRPQLNNIPSLNNLSSMNNDEVMDAETVPTSPAQNVSPSEFAQAMAGGRV